MLIYPFNHGTANYFYPYNEALSIFKTDSLHVINENGVQFVGMSFPGNFNPINLLKRFYSINFTPAFITPDNNEAFNAEKTKKIYLKYNVIP